MFDPAGVTPGGSPPRERIDEPPGPLGCGKPGDPRLVVEAWLAVPGKAGWRVLLLRRSPKDGGFWQGVSGRVEADDPSLRAAALREIREETGLSKGVTVFDLGRTCDFHGLMTGTSFRKRSLGAILPPDLDPRSVVLCDEHDAAEVVAFDEARRRVRFPENVAELTALEQRISSGVDGDARPRG